jgi:hypothetical protein
VIVPAVRIVVGNRVPYRVAGRHPGQDHRVFVSGNLVGRLATQGIRADFSPSSSGASRKLQLRVQASRLPVLIQQ